MSNINNQATSLDNIFGVEDLSCDVAANVQGGAAMTMYRHAFGDKAHRKNEVLGSFNGGGLRSLSTNAENQTSAVTITAGKWKFYDSTNWIDLPFANDTVEYGPGTYNIAGLNDKISSFRRVG